MILEVDRKDMHRTRMVADEPGALADGDARLRIETFALTSNNVTYGVFGDAMQYWNFFPADDGWGRIPVWGFGEVVETRSPGVAGGQRMYGYFPMATELVVTPGRTDARGFTDLAPHRQPMAGAYNRYNRVETDPIWRADREGQQMVLWPLFFTSFMIDDFVADNDRFGASTAVVTSASSKTAIGTAYMLHDRTGLRVVGLTSAANRDFVESLGCYHEVATYEQAGALGGADAICIDIAGNRDVVAAVHRSFGEQLRYSMLVGGTHWDHHTQSLDPLPGPQPELFFAPSQIGKRINEWGQDEVDRRVGEAWRHFVAWTDAWLLLESARGPAEVEATYHELLAGGSKPSVGHVCSMQP